MELPGEIDPDHSALVVVAMQPDFMPGGALAVCRSAIGRPARTTDFADADGWPVGSTGWPTHSDWHPCRRLVSRLRGDSTECDARESAGTTGLVRTACGRR